MNEKEALERAALSNFVEMFNNRLSRGCLSVIRRLQPPFPDALCCLNGQNVYVEIAHIYGTDADARYSLGRTGAAAPTDEERLGSSLVPLNARVICPLNRVLWRKSSKSYEGRPVWLVIRNGFPIFTLQDFKHHLADIVVPADHPFEEIWLLAGRDPRHGAIQLYGDA